MRDRDTSALDKLTEISSRAWCIFRHWKNPSMADLHPFFWSTSAGSWGCPGMSPTRRSRIFSPQSHWLLYFLRLVFLIKCYPTAPTPISGGTEANTQPTGNTSTGSGKISLLWLPDCSAWVCLSTYIWSQSGSYRQAHHCISLERWWATDLLWGLDLSSLKAVEVCLTSNTTTSVIRKSSVLLKSPTRFHVTAHWA